MMFCLQLFHSPTISPVGVPQKKLHSHFHNHCFSLNAPENDDIILSRGSHQLPKYLDVWEDVDLGAVHNQRALIEEK